MLRTVFRRELRVLCGDYLFQKLTGNWITELMALSCIWIIIIFFCYTLFWLDLLSTSLAQQDAGWCLYEGDFSGFSSYFWNVFVQKISLRISVWSGGQILVLLWTMTSSGLLLTFLLHFQHCYWKGRWCSTSNCIGTVRGWSKCCLSSMQPVCLVYKELKTI